MPLSSQKLPLCVIDVEALTLPQHASSKRPNVCIAKRRDTWHESVELKLKGLRVHLTRSVQITWRHKKTIWPIPCLPYMVQIVTIVCYRCGGPHLAPACKFKETQCLYCKKEGHLARVCRAKAQGAKGSSDSKRSNYLEAQEDDLAYTLFTLHGSNSNPITLDLALNNVPVKVELDTGAAVLVISHSTYLNICSQSQAVPALQPSLVKLKTYTGESIPIIGCASVQARYGTQVVDVHVQVVEGDGPNLLGRDLLQKLEVDLGSVNANVLEQTTPLEGILDKHSIVFSEELSSCTITN